MFEPGYTYESTNHEEVRIYDKVRVGAHPESLLGGSSTALLGAIIDQYGVATPATFTLDGVSYDRETTLIKPSWLATEKQRHWIINHLNINETAAPTLDSRKWTKRAQDAFNAAKGIFG